MKYNFARLVILMFIACMLLVQNQSALADNDPITQYANKGVKSMIEADFLNYQKPLDAAKDNFGVNADDSFANAQLGDGIPYFVVSNKIEANGNSFTFGGYIFPIRVNGKPAGIVFATEENGKWSIFNIKNNTSFEQDLQDAKKLLKDTDSAKLLYDQRFGLYIFAVQHVTGESSIVPMRDHEFLKLKKHSFVPMADFEAKLDKLKKEKASESKNGAVQAGGAVLNSDSSNAGSKYYLPIGGGLVALGTFGYVMVRKRKQAN
ncbi:hypothetical protein [Effusibacillus pohliae]|uniref:hypothetical protein n=1 Tax=Effusibacillus pohliae TaxID=232270 RepID=UPI0003658628|nr:hypothetical protein [Effusibacillus pohliae]